MQGDRQDYVSVLQQTVASELHQARHDGGGFVAVIVLESMDEFACMRIKGYCGAGARPERWISNRSSTQCALAFIILKRRTERVADGFGDMAQFRPAGDAQASIAFHRHFAGEAFGRCDEIDKTIPDGLGTREPWLENAWPLLYRLIHVWHCRNTAENF
jgi:hypothetical protein